MTLLMLIYRQQNHNPIPVSARTGSQPTRQHLLLEQAKNYIGRHYAEHLSLDAIAAALKVSPYYLSRVFRQETKFTLFAFLTEVRMQKAKMRLTDGRQTVAEAAYAVGFDDPHYFSKVFHRHFGCAPTGVSGRANPLISAPATVRLRQAPARHVYDKSADGAHPDCGTSACTSRAASFSEQTARYGLPCIAQPAGRPRPTFSRFPGWGETPLKAG